MNLTLGAKGPEVGNWQRFLNEVLSSGLVVDEHFGLLTENATRQFQSFFPDLIASGIVDTMTRTFAEVKGFIPFVQAKNCKVLYPMKRSMEVRLIVIHTMESPEKPGTALNVANWFAGPTAPMASAHYCIDPMRTIQCVREGDIAYHAPGANGDGIGIELAGKAGQSPLEWKDKESQAILARASKLVARLLKEHDLPLRKLEYPEVLQGAQGICGHIDVTRAYPPKGGGGHWDPGPNFPWDLFLEMVNGERSTSTERKSP